MSSKRKIQPITADAPLPRTLTQRFSDSLKSLLIEDGSVKANYLLEQLLTKFCETDSSSAAVRRSAAIEKWLSTETVNTDTNARLLRWGHSMSVNVLPGVSAKRFLDKVASVVSDVLPWTPSLDFRNCGFSGGATTSKGRRHSHPAVKFLAKADITRPSYPLFMEINSGSRWDAHMRTPGLEPRFVDGNVMFTVPKNSDIDRCACKEPDLNMFLQKGFGNQIRSLLKRKGVDLNDQSKNQELARRGSVDGSLMTLDLSSASDSVTTELVRRVLPFDWFYYMNLVRSERTVIDGVSHTNEMFSSMGNGFTFELESLLFYAISRAVAYFGGHRGTISVYGDDIIAPSSMADDLISALHFCGFRTNPQKSFWEGPFRESCGKHWHGGLDVSPFFIRGPFKSISDLILSLNQLTSWASREIGVVDPRYEALIMEFAEHIPNVLWGGSDLTSRTSLVTGDAPRSELTYPVEDRPILHIGGLLLWLFSTLERVQEGCLVVADASLPSFARIRRRRSDISVTHTVYVDGSPRRVQVRSTRELTVHDVPVFLSRYGVTGQVSHVNGHYLT